MGTVVAPKVFPPPPSPVELPSSPLPGPLFPPPSPWTLVSPPVLAPPLSPLLAPVPPPPPVQPAPPPPPLDAVIPPGDVCILYSGVDQAPLQLLLNVTACSCFHTCYGDEACYWRKFCAASQRRTECQAAAALAYNAGNPCPRWVGLLIF